MSHIEKDRVPPSQVADVGRMVDSSQADDRRLIHMVRKRKLLYARNNMPVASYYAKVKSLWKEVATEMGWTVADVRRKWSHIRNSYSRHLRNEMYGARTGKGRIVSKWYLADELEFLRDHMATDTRLPPYSTYAPSFLEMDLSEHSSSSEHAQDIKPFIHTPWFSLPAAAAHAPTKSETQLELNVQNDDSSSSQAFGPDENSSYFQFFRGIFNDYQELTVRRQRQFKRQCLNFLHQLLDEQEEHATSSEQTDAINLTNANPTTDHSILSGDEADQNLIVIVKTECNNIE